MGDQKKKHLNQGWGRYLAIFKITRIPDIETIQLDIQQYNVLYYTTKIPVIPDIRPWADIWPNPN